MSQLPTPVSRRRIILKHVLVNVVLVVLLVLLGAWCYSEGKTYKITLGNSAFTGRDGLEYPALEAVEVFIDREEPVFLLEDDSASGKAMGKKSLAEIAMQYGYVYVAQVAMGANPNQTLAAIREAEAYPGPSLIIGYSPCEMHSIKGGMANCQIEMKKAVACGYWNLFRYNPALKAQGKNPFTLDSKAPAGGYREFLMNEARYSSLTRSFPERAEKLFEENEQSAMERWDHLQRLIELYK